MEPGVVVALVVGVVMIVVTLGIAVAGGVFVIGRLAGHVKALACAMDKLANSFNAHDGTIINHEGRIAAIEHDREED